MKGILNQHEWHLVSASCLHVSKEFIKCTLSRKIPIVNLKEFFPTVRLVHSDKHIHGPNHVIFDEYAMLRTGRKSDNFFDSYLRVLLLGLRFKLCVFLHIF